MITVQEASTSHSFGDKPFLGFGHVTMVPMCRKLIDVSMLTPFEKEYLNAYHAEVEEKTRSLCGDDPWTLEWLHRETRPL